MKVKKKCVAMLLAGGQGSRLYTLTEKTAKPAVPFGGKYRIIDFPLSNCIKSGIDTVGVLTQYQPLVLNDYIGNGQPWDLDRNFGGVTVLPPYQGHNKADWYSGTANAIYQNLNFIERYDPDYVLILSGDHIYKMDYAAMIEAHEQSGADCTIAVIEVPIKEASRFGIMCTDETGRITEFAEKPKQPKSNLASMGIYVFNTAILKQYLTEDEADPTSAKDFGKNIIPKMLADGRAMYAYAFHGYWKDVGTIGSLWQANMDLLGEKPAFSLYDKKAKIYSRHSGSPAQYIGPMAKIRNSLLTEGCNIYGDVKNSVLFLDVTVEQGAVVEDSVVMGGSVIRSGACVSHAIIDSDVEITSGCVVGSPDADESGICVVGTGLHLGSGTVIGKGELVNEEWLAKHSGGESE